MKCEMCGKRDASVSYTEVVEGTTTTWRLCDECARERGVGSSLTSLAGPLVDMLMGLLEGSVGEGVSGDSRACPNCGLTYEQFRRVGRLGCATCYEAFGAELKPLLRRIHGSTEHTGRMPSEMEGDYLRRREIKKLKSELARAVHGEDYELAAELRDAIRSNEAELRQAEDDRADGTGPTEESWHGHGVAGDAGKGNVDV